jgi:hypothetical protein
VYGFNSGRERIFGCASTIGAELKLAARAECCGIELRGWLLGPADALPVFSSPAGEYCCEKEGPVNAGGGSVADSVADVRRIVECSVSACAHASEAGNCAAHREINAKINVENRWRITASVLGRVTSQPRAIVGTRAQGALRFT